MDTLSSRVFEHLLNVQEVLGDYEMGFSRRGWNKCMAYPRSYWNEYNIPTSIAGNTAITSYPDPPYIIIIIRTSKVAMMHLVVVYIDEQIEARLHDKRNGTIMAFHRVYDHLADVEEVLRLERHGLDDYYDEEADN